MHFDGTHRARASHKRPPCCVLPLTYLLQKLLRSQGFAVVCSCLMYSPELTLSGFETEEGGSTTADVFAAIVEGIGYRFVKKSQDAQLCMLGIANLLKTVPLASMPPGVTAVLPQLVCCFAALQARYEDLVRYEKAARDRKQGACRCNNRTSPARVCSTGTNHCCLTQLCFTTHAHVSPAAQYVCRRGGGDGRGV